MSRESGTQCSQAVVGQLRAKSFAPFALFEWRNSAQEAHNLLIKYNDREMMQILSETCLYTVREGPQGSVHSAT